MPYKSGKTIRREIAALAAGQGGYFTVKQAKALGYDRRRLAYHVNAGNFERVDHGLYRLPALPISEHDDLVRATFWSRDRNDRPQATVSHRTALSIFGFSDLFAHAIHLTVPPGFRKRPPLGCVLHVARLGPAEREERNGFWVTTPLRTLLDAAVSEDVGIEELSDAVQDALDQGAVSRKQLRQAAEKDIHKRLRVLLAQDT